MVSPTEPGTDSGCTVGCKTLDDWWLPCAEIGVCGPEEVVTEGVVSSSSGIREGLGSERIDNGWSRTLLSEGEMATFGCPGGLSGRSGAPFTSTYPRVGATWIISNPGTTAASLGYGIELAVFRSNAGCGAFSSCISAVRFESMRVDSCGRW